jgi:ubiquinone/menaquinone biosynthesis C-methylase UbiE
MIDRSCTLNKEENSMPVIQGLGWTFDTVANRYEKLRPGYTKELYDTLFSYLPLGEGSKAVEVGIGGGQATKPVLDTGCSVMAVEPGENFCQLCLEKFAAYPGFSVLNGKFEEIELAQDAFDLVYSASAFHWVPEEAGYRKAFDCLKKGGRVSVITFHSLEDRTVKQEFAALAKGCICPKNFPVCVCGKTPSAKVLKAVAPGAGEVSDNIRSRSARLRTAEKL